ncbi:MAG: dihydrofolate reductase family protein [Solirubrobacterales bacterium]|nr:dihydrofolate reductase family protein [Solirubrobacterales bacterium]
MRKLIYSMTTSLDGFIADADGQIDWTAPDEELFRFHTEQTRELGAHLLGRGLYEAMLYWETADRDPVVGDASQEFAPLWRALPKIVFSSSLETVEGNARLATDSLAEEVARIKRDDGKDIGIGGAGLAGACVRLGLIDEYRPFVSPVVLGGGTPFFPALDERIGLSLVETRTFPSRVQYMRYRVAG